MSTGRHKQERGVGLQPLDEINGYQVRPGFITEMVRQQPQEVSALRSIPLVRRHVIFCCSGRRKRAVCDPKISGGLSYWKHIFHVRFGLKIEEFEYAFQLDGPYDEKKGLLFKKKKCSA